MREVVREQIEEVAQQLPAHKEHEEVDARHHAEQHEGREADERQKPAVAAILIQVADGVAVNDRAHPRDEHHHDRAEPVDAEPQREGERPGGSGIIEPNGGRSIRDDHAQCRDGAEKGRGHGCHAQLRAFMLRRGLPDQDKEDRQQRQERDEDHERHARRHGLSRGGRLVRGTNKAAKNKSQPFPQRENSAGLHCNRPSHRRKPAALPPRGLLEEPQRSRLLMIDEGRGSIASLRCRSYSRGRGVCSKGISSHALGLKAHEPNPFRFAVGIFLAALGGTLYNRAHCVSRGRSR